MPPTIVSLPPVEYAPFLPITRDKTYRTDMRFRQVLKDKEGKEMDTIRIDSWSHDTIVDFFKERLA
jgi:transposase-like protein